MQCSDQTLTLFGIEYCFDYIDENNIVKGEDDVKLMTKLVHKIVYKQITSKPNQKAVPSHQTIVDIVLKDFDKRKAAIAASSKH